MLSILRACPCWLSPPPPPPNTTQQDLCERLRGATRVVLAGNGGIALELM